MTGPTRALQPWEIAMPAAVVGPPILALEARMMSSRSKCSSLPPTKQNSMFTTTMMAVNASSSGVSVKILDMEAGTPMTNRKR